MDTLPGDKKDAKVLQSTISRFACRILVDRNDPYKARIYAAGFDSSRNIFLGVSIRLLMSSIKGVLDILQLKKCHKRDIFKILGSIGSIQ